MKKIYLCPKCYEVFALDSYPGEICPRLGCGGFFVFGVDEAMLETIIILNKKGYKTKCCCSGHVHRLSNIYIAFHPECEDRLINNLPEGFKFVPSSEHQDNDKFDFSFTIQDDIPYCERMKLFSDKNIELYNWACSLPVFLED